MPHLVYSIRDIVEDNLFHIVKLYIERKTAVHVSNAKYYYNHLPRLYFIKYGT